MKNYFATVGITEISMVDLILCSWLVFAEAPLLYAGTGPPNEEESLMEAPPISIESDPGMASPTQDELRRRFHDRLERPPSAPEERRLADGTLEITTPLVHLCAKPLLAQPASGVGGNIRLAAPCAGF
jgi:hypothetical protein